MCVQLASSCRFRGLMRSGGERVTGLPRPLCPSPASHLCARLQLTRPSGRQGDSCAHPGSHGRAVPGGACRRTSLTTCCSLPGLSGIQFTCASSGPIWGYIEVAFSLWEKGIQAKTKKMLSVWHFSLSLSSSPLLFNCG